MPRTAQSRSHPVSYVVRGGLKPSCPSLTLQTRSTSSLPSEPHQASSISNLVTDAGLKVQAKFAPETLAGSPFGSTACGF